MDQLEFNEQELSILKGKLEVEKLQKEIEGITLNNAQLEKEWYRKPQWIAAVSPIVIGILTLIVAWASGFLQAQSTLNKIQQETFNRTKDSISHAITRSIIIQDSLYNMNLLLATKNKIFDSTNKQVSGFLKVMRDSFQTADQKRKYFSNKLFSLQIELLALKLERQGIIGGRMPYVGPKYFSIFDSTIKVTDSDILEYINGHSLDTSKPFVDFKK